jgi:hypothetical protein
VEVAREDTGPVSRLPALGLAVRIVAGLAYERFGVGVTPGAGNPFVGLAADGVGFVWPTGPGRDGSPEWRAAPGDTVIFEAPGS